MKKSENFTRHHKKIVSCHFRPICPERVQKCNFFTSKMAAISQDQGY